MNETSNLPLRATRACIDLDAFDHNLTLLSSRVHGAGMVAMVKANAYGHGLPAMALAAQGWGAKMLGVANLEECYLLRQCGISVPVLILEELFYAELPAALEVGATLSVGSVGYARELSRLAHAAGRTVEVHVNLETGMGRMGLFSADPVGDVLEIASLPGLAVVGVFSHFPASDEADFSFALEQIGHMQTVLTALAARGLRPRYRHIANSGGLIAFPESLTDSNLVRPGVSIYGMLPSAEVSPLPELRPVLELRSRIVRLTPYDRPWTVGYGRTYEVGPGSLIGIVPIGYGDGWPRALSNRGSALIHGRRVPIAGRLSMDMTALDLTALKDQVALNDEVVLIGSSGEHTISVADIATLCGTITYEITCGLNERIPRVYLRGGIAVAEHTLSGGYRAGSVRP